MSSRVSNSLDLPAGVVSVTGQWTDPPPAPLLTFEAGEDRWRVLELQSVEPVDAGGSPIGGRQGRSFDAHLEWGSAGGAVARSQITVPRATRVCIYARTVRVSVVSRSVHAQRVFGVVQPAPAPLPTRNQLCLRGNAGVGAVQVPAWASTARLELADPAAAAASQLDLYDGQGALRVRVPAALQPADGLDVGDVERIVVTAAAAWRLAFTLNL